jgi:hypothetical protein
MILNEKAFPTLLNEKAFPILWIDGSQRNIECFIINQENAGHTITYFVSGSLLLLPLVLYHLYAI